MWKWKSWQSKKSKHFDMTGRAYQEISGTWRKLLEKGQIAYYSLHKTFDFLLKWVLSFSPSASYNIPYKR